jgi:RsiW-degrading membrane proteinase PrsW (M82 family)
VWSVIVAFAIGKEKKKKNQGLPQLLKGVLLAKVIERVECTKLGWKKKLIIVI